MKSIARRFKGRQSLIPPKETTPTPPSPSRSTAGASADLSGMDISRKPFTQVSATSAKREPASGSPAISDKKVATGEKSEIGVSALSHSDRALAPSHPRLSNTTNRTSSGHNSSSPPLTSSESNSTPQNLYLKVKDTESEKIGSDSLSKSTEASSSRTFGNDADKRKAVNFHVTLDGKVDPSEKTYTLKPITHETVYHHVTEEVQRVKQQERHLTHIQHHVQPVLDPQYGFEDHTYRMGSVDPFDPRKVVGIEKTFIDSVLQAQILSNQHRYQVDAKHLCPKIQSIDLADIEKTSTVVHNYHIIQPVIINSDPRFKATTTVTGSSKLASAPELKSGELLEDKDAGQLKNLIKELTEENQKLKELLECSRSSRVAGS